MGERLAPVVAGLLAQQPDEPESTAADPRKPLEIAGTEGAVVSYAHCCYPIPGDEIVGFMSSGRGIVIHRDNCRNLAEYRKQPAKWIPVNWTRGVKGEFDSEIQVRTLDRVGLLAEVAGRISATHTNIEHVRVDTRRRCLGARVPLEGARPPPAGAGSPQHPHDSRRRARVPQRRLTTSRTAWQSNRFTRPRAPAAIGPYSQAIRAGNTVYLSGQIPLDPVTMELVKGDIRAQIRQVFDNLAAVAEAVGRLARERRAADGLSDGPREFSARQRDHGASTARSRIRRAPRSASRSCRAAPPSRSTAFSSL